MLIRKATPEDAAVIAPYLMLAMRDIVFYFIGENSSEKAIQFLEGLIKERGNQYSYENCFVAEVEGGSCGSCNCIQRRRFKGTARACAA